MIQSTPSGLGDTLALSSELSAKDPDFFLRTVMGVDPWPRQLEILEAVRDHKRTTVQSCHAIGKDWTAAHTVMWFLYSHVPCTVITTAPTARQVRHILWGEIRQAHRKLPLGRCLTMSLDIHEDWRALGFTASEYEPAAFQGFHGKNVLVIVDEAVGIARDIYDAIEGVLSAGFARCLEIGNPTDPNSEFARRARSLNTHTMSISAFETPNFTEFGIERKDIDSGEWAEKVGRQPLPRPYLITPSWVADQVQRYGWEDPFVISRVLGRFPGAGSNALLRDDWIDGAAQRELVPEGRRILSCDVAREGDDETVIGFRCGARYRKVYSERQTNLMQLASRLRALWREYQAEEVRVDDDGLGGGVTDRLHELEVPVVAMRGGMTPNEPERFANNRAEWHWSIRQRFEDGDIDIDSRDFELIEQLRQFQTGGFSARGAMRMEAKEQYKKRVGRSPDDVDALVYAFAPVGLKPKIQVFF